MTFTREEKRTTWIAGTAGAVVLAGYFILLPLWSRWTSLGEALDPKLEAIEKLQERANAQNALLTRRDALAARLGAIEGRDAQAASPAPRPAPRSVEPSPPGASAAPPVAGKLSAPVKPTPPGKLAGPSKLASPGKPDSPGTLASSDKPAPIPQKGPTAAGPQPGPPAEGAPSASAGVAAYVERQTAASGVRVNNMTPIPPAYGYKRGKYLAAVGLQVSMETTASSLIKLLYALEKGDRLIRVEQMNLRHDVKKGEALTVTLRIVGYESTAR